MINPRDSSVTAYKVYFSSAYLKLTLTSSTLQWLDASLFERDIALWWS